MDRKPYSPRIIIFLLALCMAACAPLIAGYSLDAYKNATSLKAETLALVDQAGEPFTQHAQEVSDLRTKLDAAYEFAAGMPKNSLSASQWRILKDPERDLVGGFLRDWERDGTKSAGFIAEKHRQIAGAFDDIICLEANKEKDTECVQQ